VPASRRWSIDGAFGAAGPNQRVELVDKQDRVFGSANLVHDGLDPFFELAAVLGAGDHHGQVQHDDAPVAQQFRNAAINDQLCQSLDNGRLADARFAQEYRLFLCDDSAPE